MKDCVMIFQSDMLFVCPVFLLRRLKIIYAFREWREREKLFAASSGSNVFSFRLCILQK